MSGRDLLADWTEALKEAGIEDARRELLALLAHVTSMPLVKTLSTLDEPVDDRSAGLFRQLACRRADREPLAYLIGETGFSGLELVVGPGALVPRPDSETLVEAAVAAIIEDRSRRDFMLTNKRIRILDTCTGTGAIGIAIAVRLHEANIPVFLQLVDVSETALLHARKNVARWCKDFPVIIEQADLFPLASEPFDLITANPPYISDEVLPGLMPEVSRHEPALALAGGTDGLDIFRRILERVTVYLNPGGLLFFEHGFDQAKPVADLISRTDGLEEPALYHDFGKNPRVTACRRV